MDASALPRHRAVALPRSRRLLAALGDDRLVEQVRRGNEAAFEVIYDRHHRGILAFCRHMLGSRDEAEDAVQHTFTSAFTDLQSNEREIRLKAWLYTIARNRCLSMLRARREQPAELDEQATAGLSEEVQRRADLRDLLHDLGDLPDDQREALVLFEVGDLSQVEVAGVIGVEPMKVKALVYQARSALIEKREARAIPCADIREELATATGGALRRGPLRRHLKVCEGCSEYRDRVRVQRSSLALVLPVAPTVGLKDAVLTALGFGGGAGGAGVATGAAGGAIGAAAGGGGGTFAAIAGMGGTKLIVAATIAGGGLIGTGVAIEGAVDDSGSATAQAADASDGGAASAGGGSSPGATAGTTIAERDEREIAGRSDGNDGDKRDDREDGKRAEDDERSDADKRSDRAERGRDNRAHKGRASRGRGEGNRRSRSRGKGRSAGRRAGSRAVRPPRGPKKPGRGNSGSNSGNSGSTGSDSGSSGGSGSTAGERKGGRVPDPTEVVPAPVTDGVDAGTEPRKEDDKERLLPAVPLPE